MSYCIIYCSGGRIHRINIHPLVVTLLSLQIKRMKQLEQEKDVLLQGLEAVERTKDWYHQQLSAVQEKQKYIGRGASPNVSYVDLF